MASISGFSTYTKLTSRKKDSSKLEVSFQLLGGDGSSLTYPKGGIPISNANLGFAYGQMDWCIVVDSAGTGYDYEWNRANNSIQIWTPGATGAAFVEAATGLTPSANLTVVCVGF